VEGEPFISELDTLEKAVASFFHICFVANISYPVGSGILCSFLQRCAAKLDELGTTASFRKKDQVAKKDKALRPFRKSLIGSAARCTSLSATRSEKSDPLNYLSVCQSMIFTEMIIVLL